MTKSGNWLEEEISFLRDNYKSNGLAYCCANLNRGISSVKTKASKMGLNKRPIYKSFEDKLKALNILVQPLESYIDGDTLIFFKCPEGHVFKQRPRSVIERQGKCPTCSISGFNINKPAYLYLIEFPYGGEGLYKLGITNNTPESRHISDLKDLKGTICWKVLYESGEEAKNTETFLKNKYKDNQYNTGLLRSGNTETYDIYINKPEIQCFH